MVFKIDSIPIKNNYFISTFNSKTGECLKRYHLNFDFPGLIITPLKEKVNISDHFTEPKIYVSEGYFDTYAVPDTPKMVIFIPETFNKEIFYIAYDQNVQDSAIVISQHETQVIVPQNGLIKTNLYPCTLIYAYNNYYAYFFDSKKKWKIPIISGQELKKLDYLTTDQQESFFNQKGIYKNSKYLVPRRFNPDRERVVNIEFNEIIKGQVQDFQLVVYK